MVTFRREIVLSLEFNSKLKEKKKTSLQWSMRKFFMALLARYLNKPVSPVADDLGGEGGGVRGAGERSALGDGCAPPRRLAGVGLHHLRPSQLLLQRQRASGPQEPERRLRRQGKGSSPRPLLLRRPPPNPLTAPPLHARWRARPVTRA